MDIQQVARRLEDPIHYLCEEAVLALPVPSMAQLCAYVMGHLPTDLPAWAVRYVRSGVQRELKSELKRLGRVFRDGRYFRLAALTLREFEAYIHHLEENSARDRARIKHLKSEFRRAEAIAGLDSTTPIGELLGWSEGEAA